MTCIEGRYVVHLGNIYRIRQTHTAQEHYPPDAEGVEALYKMAYEGRTELPPEDELEIWSADRAPYSKLKRVAHVGFVWESQVDHNVWEPGAPGVQENIWKKVDTH